MIPSPIRKALSTIRAHRVDHLLMGGQACVLYGAAEFSRDVDLALLPDPDNLDRLRAALADLDAEVIAVPPFRREFLDAGLAVHFRCRHPEARGLRIDVMTRLRGVEPFLRLWARRTSFEFDGETLDVLSLPDLVAAKKTQRDGSLARALRAEEESRRSEDEAYWRPLRETLTGSAGSSVGASKVGALMPARGRFPRPPRLRQVPRRVWASELAAPTAGRRG